MLVVYLLMIWSKSPLLMSYSVFEPTKTPRVDQGGFKGGSFFNSINWKNRVRTAILDHIPRKIFLYKNHQIQLFLTSNYPYFDPDLRHKHCGPPGTCGNSWKNSLKRPFGAKIWYLRKPNAKPPAAPNFLKWSQFDPNPRASEKTVKQLGAAGGFPQGPKNSFFITINWKNMVEMVILRSRYPNIFLYKNHQIQLFLTSNYPYFSPF